MSAAAEFFADAIRELNFDSRRECRVVEFQIVDGLTEGIVIGADLAPVVWVLEQQRRQCWNATRAVIVNHVIKKPCSHAAII